MFDEEDSDFERSEFEIWYDDNFKYFARGADSFFEADNAVEYFYLSVYRPIMQELTPAIDKLVMKQYPIIDKEQRPAVLEAIERVLKRTGHNFLLGLYNLVLDQKEGLNLREKYPDFDKWATRKKEVSFFSRTIFDSVKGLTQRQKDELYELIKKEFHDSFNWKDQLRYEFIEVIQPIVFKYFKAIHDFDADCWVIYFYLLVIEHTDYRLDFEHYVSFIDYEFYEEDLNIPYAEYQRKFQEKYNARRENEQRLTENDEDDL